LVKGMGPFGAPHTRVAVWVFGNKHRTRQVIPLNKYHTFPQFVRAVRRIRFIGGRPNLPKILKKAPKKTFKHSPPGTLRTVFVVTASPVRGRKYRKKLRKVVPKLTRKGITVYPYTFGPARRDPIFSLVFSSRNVVQMTTFNLHLIHIPPQFHLQLGKWKHKENNLYTQKSVFYQCCWFCWRTLIY
jgi:hypothetical protein